MPCTTFLHDGELNVPTSNAILNGLLQEVREATKGDWQLIERTLHIKRLFRKEQVKPLYSLYLYVGGVGPWQEISFYTVDGNSSVFGVGVSADQIAAYFYGVLAK